MAFDISFAVHPKGQIWVLVRTRVSIDQPQDYEIEEYEAPAVAVAEPTAPASMGIYATPASLISLTNILRNSFFGKVILPVYVYMYSFIHPFMHLVRNLYATMH